MWKKGLIIAAVPLLFELVFVGLLFKIYQELDNELAQMKKAKEVIEHIQNVRDFSERAAEVLARYKSSQREEDLQTFDQLIEGVPRELEAIKVDVKDDPEQLSRVELLEQEIPRLRFILLNYRQSLKNDEHSFEQMSWLIKAAPIGQRVRQNVDQLLLPYGQKEDIYFKALEKQRANQWTLLWEGVVLNFAVAAAVVFYYASRITNRVAIIVDNTHRLARKQPLNEVIDGDDELVEVDLSFHQTSDQLADAERKARELERVKQEFVSMVSHDLRSPLTSLQVTLDLLSDGTYGELNETGQKRVDTAGKSVIRLVGLINDLLDLEKMESGMLSLNIDSVPIKDLFEQAEASICGFAEQYKVRLEIKPSEAVVRGDGERLVQVLVNLLSNAIKFSPAGAAVTLSATVESANGDGQVCKISVIDRGRGIPEQFRHSIFDRFQQVEKADGQRKKGTGLGLAISKAIVELHGGKIALASEEGKGSTFWISLPIP